MQVREVNGVKYIHVYSSNDSKGREIKAYEKIDNVFPANISNRVQKQRGQCSSGPACKGNECKSKCSNRNDSADSQS